MASDQDLKTSDLLRYYVRDTEAAKNLLYRRARCLADFENANKALDKARVKGKEVAAVSCRDFAHSLHTELTNASRSTNLFTNSCNHISTNGNALLHSHINHNNPQFLYSL